MFSTTSVQQTVQMQSQKRQERRSTNEASSSEEEPETARKRIQVEDSRVITRAAMEAELKHFESVPEELWTTERVSAAFKEFNSKLPAADIAEEDPTRVRYEALMDRFENLIHGSSPLALESLKRSYRKQPALPSEQWKIVAEAGGGRFVNTNPQQWTRDDWHLYQSIWNRGVLQGSFDPTEKEYLAKLEALDAHVTPIVASRIYLRWLFDPILVIADLSNGVPAGWVADFGDFANVGNYPPAAAPAAAGAPGAAGQLPPFTPHLGQAGALVFEFANRDHAMAFVGYVRALYPGVRLQVIAAVTPAAMVGVEKY